MYSGVLYDEIDIFAILVLFIIMDRSKHSFLTTDQRLFNAELKAVMLALFFDALTWTFNEQTFPGARTLNVIANYFYWFSTLFPCYIGLLYCTYVAVGRLEKSWSILFSIPVFAAGAILVCNVWNDGVFYVTDTNEYTRGELFLAVGSLPIFHMGLAVLITLWKYAHAQEAERHKYIMLMLFMLFPLLSMLMQICIYGILTIWTGLTLSVLMCYVYIQQGNLSTDPLTGLNNRRRFDAYSMRVWRNLKGSSMLYIIMLDIDRFKLINDTYGHAEGDCALIRAADTLKRSIGGKKGFLARIGGDEFAIILENEDEEAVRALVARIHSLMEQENEAAGRTYKLHFSIGFAGVSGEDKSDFNGLFAKADADMYEQKRATRISVTE